MTSTDPSPRRRGWRWLRRLALGLALVGLVLAFGGWFRGQAQWGPFRGQTVNVETGAPIAGANVMVSWGFRRFGELMARNFDARETVTDAQGHFELPRLWRLWSLDVMEPGIGYFAPGYVATATEVTPPDGLPYLDPTVIKMRPLNTREERCRRRPGSPLHDKAPLFLDAVRRYRLGLDC
jgi:hypothetical protein